MRQKQKLTQTIQFWGVFLIIGVFCSIVLIDIIRSNQTLKRNSEQIREEYVTYQKKILVQEVEHAINLISYGKMASRKFLKAEVQERVYEAHAIAQNIYIKNKESHSKAEIQAMILDALRPIRFSNGGGYYFISHLDGLAILHAAHPELEGTNVLATTNTQGKHIIQDFIAIAKQPGEGFYEYNWNHPGIPGKDFRKISFVKYFEPFNWCIGTGLYVYDTEKLLQKRLLESIEHIRFGENNDGYIFVVSYDGITLMNGTQKNLIGKNIWDLTDPNGVKVVQQQRKTVLNPEGGFIYYTWNKPSTKRLSPKTSFIKGVSDWQWMVGAGVYLDDIEDEILMTQEKVYSQIKRRVFLFSLLALAVLTLFLLFFTWLSQKLSNDVKLLLSFFRQAAFANEPIDLQAVYFDELDQMAKNANKMLVDKIQAQKTLMSEKEIAQESEHDLAAAQKIAKIGSYHRDLSHQTMVWSNELYRITGLQHHTLPLSFETYLQLIHPDDREHFLQITARENIKPLPYEIHYRILRPDAGIVHVVERAEVQFDEINTPTRVIGTIQDITELKELEEDRTRLVTAISQASESILITDIDGIIQYINPSFEHLTGYSKEEVIGQNPRILKSGKHDREFYSSLWKTLLQGEVWHGHLCNMKKDGTFFEEEASISPIKDQQGKITNFVAVKRDVSKEVLLEKQLRQAVKMEAIGTLAGGIAHDFNNILAAILGYGEMAKAQLPVEHLARKDISQVLKAGNRAKDLVKQILTFSRQGEEAFAPIKLQEIIAEILQLLKSSLPSTIQIVATISPESRMVLADATQVHQVLMNLCTNAKHAMGDSGGTLTVSLTELVVGQQGEVSDCPQLEAGNYLRLGIQDTGCGMDPSTLSNIFDPFFTTKELGKGTGLGLAVVHGIIKQHHGEISVSSVQGEGTLFHIYLPTLHSKHIQVPRSALQELPQGTEHILVVDDETVISHIMQRMLTSLGYDVTALNSSLDALETFTDAPETFDLLITDMTMPHMTGAILAQKILAHSSDFPIIMCTGFSETMNKQQAKAIGVREFILKPILKEQLATTVRKVLDHG